MNRYYKIVTNNRGEKFLQTKNPNLAKALAFCFETMLRKIEKEDKRTGVKHLWFSIAWTEEVQNLADQLIELHLKALEVQGREDREQGLIF